MTSTVKSADRVLRILELFTENPAGHTLTEFCELLQIPKSSAHSLLSTMMARQFVAQDEETRRFHGGIRLWQAAQSFPDVSMIADVARPHMEALRDRVNETVQLALLDGIENVYIAKVDPDQQLRLASRVGVRLPAYATGVGKALLGGLHDDELRRRFAGVEFQRFTPRTVPDLDSLLAVIAEVRARGFAVDRSEYTPGVFCVACPITDRDGDVAAAMSVSMPDVRRTSAVVRLATDALRASAREISDRLGYGRQERPPRR